MAAIEGTKTRIVVGVDWSDTGDHALQHAVELAKQLPNTELHVTHVIPADPGLHDARKLDEFSREIPSRLSDLRRHVTQVCAPPAGSASFHLDTCFHIRIGKPAPAIHQVAVDIDAHVIVVGTHGRTGVEKFMLGSVAEELVRTSRVTVVVARPKNFEGLAKSERLEPARPGQSPGAVVAVDRVHLEFLPRSQHISGLI
jgi:nucleotide-binding universal stress UspA family protein